MEANDWTPAKEEVRAYDDFQNHFDDETGAYRKLERLQGLNVPKMLGTITFRTSPVSQDDPFQKFFEVQGVLLEHVHGFKPSELTLKLPRDH